MVAYVPPKQAGKYKAVASGAITNGKPVIVNSTGTVTQISESASSVGSEQVWSTNSTYYSNICFDSTNNRIVIAYYDEGNTSGRAIVGTVSSDGSISYGTPVEFEGGNSGSQGLDLVHDSNSNKIVIVYNDVGNSHYGTAIVGTVDSSDNSISFGSATVFESAESSNIGAVFDSNSNKVVVHYADAGSGAKGTAIVGTVSGTSISFGSAVVFETGFTVYINAAFDSTNNKVVIAYNDDGNSQAGTAVVGTVSGTGISFGTPVVFKTGDPRWNSVAHDPVNERTVIAYHDSSNSDYPTAIVGTVSGTSISFGTAVVIQSTGNYGTASTFDSDQNKIIISYRDYSAGKARIIEGTVSGTTINFGSSSIINEAAVDGVVATNSVLENVYDTSINKTITVYREAASVSGSGTAIAYASAVATNITSENYIGIASGGTYADTAEATIDVVGTVNKDQSGLTAGQTYYVQTDGTLGTSADDPSVVAGTAISATELIVKG